MKTFLLATLFCIVSVPGLSAQVAQTNGPLTVSLESTRIVGDRMIVSGKMTVDREVRLRTLKTSVISADGDTHSPTNLVFGGKGMSILIFDEVFQAGIPYSFDLYFETGNANMDPLSAFMIELRDHNANGALLEFMFPNVRVPMAPDPNIVPGTIEIGKNIYLRWTGFEESTAGLKVNFVVENKANKDQTMSFYAYNNAKIIDRDGNIHEGPVTLRDRITFPAGIPVAGSLSIEQAVRMADVLMIQFKSSAINYSVRELVFPQ